MCGCGCWCWCLCVLVLCLCGGLAAPCLPLRSSVWPPFKASVRALGPRFGGRCRSSGPGCSFLFFPRCSWDNSRKTHLRDRSAACSNHKLTSPRFVSEDVEKSLKPGVPRTPASEPRATNAHHHHLGRRPDDIYMSSATFWLESSSHSCLPRPQFTPYAVDTQWLFMSGFKVFSDAEKAAAPQLHPTPVAALQLFLLGLVLRWALVLQQRWYVCGGSSSRDRIPGSGSEERDGCCSVVSKPGDDVAHHFSSQLDSTTRSDDHITTPPPVSLPPSVSIRVSSTSLIKGTFSTSHRTRTLANLHGNCTRLHGHGYHGYAVDSCLREKARRRQS